MKIQETPIVFQCADKRLIGIVATPSQSSHTGILIVVGGPQYRSGSHRQFTLLARELARNGYPTCRFDYRGMGDSEGEMRSFENVNEDLKAAIDAFQNVSMGVEHIIIWGLCDGASAALYYSYTDRRVTGLVLLNPWVHSAAGEGRMRIKHYYLTRLFQKSFWLKLFSGEFNFISSVLEFINASRHLLAYDKTKQTDIAENNFGDQKSYIERMLLGIKSFSGKILIIRSENDLVSQEFGDLLQTDKEWQMACLPPKVEQSLVAGANHTFSSREWRHQAEKLTSDWINKISRQNLQNRNRSF